MNAAFTNFKTSTELDKFAPAFIKAQAEMGSAKKTSVNPHFKSKYADLAEVIDTVKLPLNSNGICFLQSVHSQEGMVCVTTTLLHSSGQYWESTFGVIPTDWNPQKLGSLITYLKRYSLAAICGIAADEDDDSNTATPAKPATPQATQTVFDATNKAHQTAFNQKLETAGITDPEQRKKAYQYLHGKAWTELEIKTAISAGAQK
jgi:hypothetical protein